MGAIQSCLSRRRESAVLFNKDAATYIALGLTKDDVGQLYDAFVGIEEYTQLSKEQRDKKHRPGFVRVGAICAYLDLERSSLSSTIFTLFSRAGDTVIQRSLDGTGLSITFRSFVLATWNLCTVPVFSLSAFIFELYDTDESRELDRSVLALMMADMYGAAYKSDQNLVKLHRILVHGLPGEDPVQVHADMRFAKFRDFCGHFNTFLAPLVKLQHAAMTHICGSRFWARCSHQRLLVTIKILSKNTDYSATVFPGLSVPFLPTKPILQIEMSESPTESEHGDAHEDEDDDGRDDDEDNEEEEEEGKPQVKGAETARPASPARRPSPASRTKSMKESVRSHSKSLRAVPMSRIVSRSPQQSRVITPHMRSQNRGTMFLSLSSRSART